MSTMDKKIKRTFSLETDIPFLLEEIEISSIRGIIIAMTFALIVAVVFHTLNFIIHFRERHVLNRKTNCQHLITTICQTISAFLAYVMVLCVMTYNVWLLVSILLGSGIGQLIIGPFISIRLDQNYISARNETNEIVTDLLPESDAYNNGDDNRQNLDRRSESGAPQPGSVQISLKDLLINKPNKSGNNTFVPKTLDDDQVSEYDSLISDIQL